MADVALPPSPKLQYGCISKQLVNPIDHTYSSPLLRHATSTGCTFEHFKSLGLVTRSSSDPNPSHGFITPYHILGLRTEYSVLNTRAGDDAVGALYMLADGLDPVIEAQRLPQYIWHRVKRNSTSVIAFTRDDRSELASQTSATCLVCFGDGGD
jgi:hypothetical protein